MLKETGSNCDLEEGFKEALDTPRVLAHKPRSKRRGKVASGME